MNLLLISILLFVFIASSAVALRLAWRQRDTLAPIGQSLRAGADGIVSIPILSAVLRGRGIFGGMAKNSIKPRLALTADGLHFKVLREERWGYEQLTRVDVSKGLLGSILAFSTVNASLIVTVRDPGSAREVLAALPHTLPLSQRAASLRDSGAV